MNSLAFPSPAIASHSRNSLSILKDFDTLQVIQKSLADYSQERLITVNLDGDHKVIGFEVVRIGPKTIEARVVEVFSSTLHFDASTVVVVHFIPNGDGILGEGDRRLAEKLKAAAEMMGLEMDYIVTGA